MTERVLVVQPKHWCPEVRAFIVDNNLLERRPRAADTEITHVGEYVIRDATFSSTTRELVIKYLISDTNGFRKFRIVYNHLEQLEGCCTSTTLKPLPPLTYWPHQERPGAPMREEMIMDALPFVDYTKTE